MSIGPGPLMPKWVNKVAPGWRCRILPVGPARVSTVSTAMPLSAVSQWLAGSSRGTSAGRVSVTLWPSARANW